MQSTLQQRPKVFQPVSMNASPNVLVSVSHYIMRVLASEFVVCNRIIGVKFRTKLYIVQNLCLQSFAFYIRDYLSANLPRITIKNSLHSGLIRILRGCLPVGSRISELLNPHFTALVHIANPATNKTLIRFDFAAVSAELASGLDF